MVDMQDLLTNIQNHGMELFGQIYLVWQQLDMAQVAGTQTAALAAGGVTPTGVAATEEWTGEVATANSKTLTTS
jgi:hypothetical protein